MVSKIRNLRGKVERADLTNIQLRHGAVLQQDEDAREMLQVPDRLFGNGQAVLKVTLSANKELSANKKRTCCDESSLESPESSPERILPATTSPVNGHASPQIFTSASRKDGIGDRS